MAAESSGPQVVSGTASFQGSGGNLTVTTGSNRTIINWNSFGVPSGTTTKFIQPGSSSAVLNRVLGNLPSRIDGSLLSNGRVYLINPHGIVVGANGVINTAGFVGSTLDVNDAQFLSGGDLRFTGSSTEAIVNLGRIEASDGNVFLIAARLENQGSIKAVNGTVGLVAAKDVLLTGNNQVFIQPTEGFLDGTGIKNSGTIEAARAELTAQGNLYALAINNSGTVNATSVVNDGGRVLLRADGGSITNTGNLTAKRVGPDGKTTGGEIEVLAEVVDLDGNAILDASGDLGGGQINIGGNKQGQGPLPNARLTHVGEGVQIFADALEVGNGGTVIVWADDSTYFNGKVFARGGANGGDGGFVETSGKQNLWVNSGIADASSAKGNAGVWLLDPNDIVVDSSGAGTIPQSFGGGGTVNINASTINAAGAGTTVVLQADKTITVNTAISMTNNNAGITMQAGGDITINQSITTKGGTLLISANDPGGQSGLNGKIILATGAILDTTGGGQTGGAITLKTNGSSGTIDLGAGLTTGNASIAITGNVVLKNTISFGAGNGSVSISGKIDANAAGAQGLTINTSGTVTLGGVIGTVSLDSLSVTGSAINLNGASVTTANAQTYTGAVTLGTGVTLTTGAGAGDDITFSSTITGASNGLILDAGAGGAVSIGGDATGLASLSATGTTISLKKVATNGSQAYIGATTLNDTLTVNNAGFGVSVTGTTTLAGSGGTITLSATSNAANDVTLGTVTGAGKTLSITAAGGDVTLGSMGSAGVGALGGVSVQANTLTLNGGIFTDGAGAALDFSSAKVASVTIGGAVTIDTENGSGTAGSVTFSGATISGTGSLNIDTTGATPAGVTMGTVSSLDSLTIKGSTISLQATTTNKAQAYTGATTLNGTLTVNNAGFGVTVTGATTLAGTGGTITLSATSNAANDVTLGTVTGTGKTLSITAAGGDVSVGQVGASGTELAAVTIDAGTGSIALTGTVDTTGSQSYTAATTTLNNTLTVVNPGFGVTVSGAVTLAGSAGTITLSSTSNAGNDVSLGAVTGAGKTLSITAKGGDVSVGQIGASGTELAAVTIDAGTGTITLNGTVDTLNAQSYTAATTTLKNTLTVVNSGFGVTISNAVVLSGSGGTITLSSSSNAANDVSMGAVTGSGTTLNITATGGDVSVGQLGASGTELAAVTIDATGGSITLNGTVDTLNAQSYTATTTTLKNTLTVKNAGFGVTAAGAVTLAGSGGTITLSATSNAANDVTLGTVTGAGKTLNITAKGGDVSVGQIGASGTELLAVLIDATGGTIVLNSTVDTTGAQSYTGATTLKNNLTSTGDAIGITGTATLGAAVTLKSGGGAGDDIIFSSTIAGAGFGLTLNAGANGAISIGGDATGLASLSASGTTVSVQKVTTSGGQDYTGTTTLNKDLTSTGNGTIVFNSDVLLATGAIKVQSAGAATDAITFKGKIDNAQALTVNAGLSTVTFQQAVGTVSLTSLDVTGGTIDINGGVVKTTGAQTYNNNVVLSADAILTGTAITFKGTVESPGTAFSLTVNGSGVTDFQAAIGGNSNPLKFLLTDSAGTTKIGGNITTSGLSGIVFDDAVTVTAALTLTANSSGVVTFAKAVTATGAGALTVTAGGDTTFQSTVSLVSLQTDGGGKTVLSGNVTTTGAAGIVFTDDVILNNAGATITLGSGGNPITLAKVDATSGESLTVNAGAGALTLNNTLGGGTALTNVSLTTSNAAAVALPTINATGIVTLSFGGAVTQSGSTTITAGTLRLEGISYNLDKSGNSVGTLQTTGTNVSGAITYITTAAVQTGNIVCGILVIEHDGALKIGGNITASSFRESNVGNSGGSAGGVDVLVGALRTVDTSSAGGAITFKSNIVLHGDLTLNAGATGGTITLADVDDAVSGAHTLTLTGGGFSFGTLGTPNKLAQVSLTTNQAGGITVTASGINADIIGFSNLGGALTVGSNISANQISLTAAGLVHVNGILTATTGAAKVTITGTGADQTQKIVATNLVLDGTGTFTLTNSNNDVANLSTLSNTIGSISLTSIAATLNLNGIDTTGTAGSGDLTVTGSGSNNLKINGPVALLGSFISSNFVATTLAGSLSVGANKDLSFGGTLTISGSAALTVTGTGILTLNNVAGLGADFTLNTGAGPGGGVASLHLTGTLGSTGDLGTVVINSSGPVLQDTGSSQTINAATLDLRGSADYTLNTSVATLHSNGGTVTGNIDVTNDKALTIGTSSFNASGSISLKTTLGDITFTTSASAGTTFSVNAAGAVHFNNSVAAGAASTLTVTAGTGADGAGVLSANVLDLNGTGTFNLKSSVTSFTANLSSGSIITLSNNKTIGLDGITAPGGLSVTTTAGDINVHNTPAAVTGGITLDAFGNLSFDATIGLSATGTIDLTWSVAGSLSTDGTNALSAGTLTLNGGNAINVTKLSVDNLGGTVSAGVGTILITNSKALSFNNFNAGTKDVTVTTLVGGVSQGAGTAITDNGLGTFTVSSAGAITLSNSGNDFGTFKVTATGGTVAVRDTNGLDLGGISASGNILNVQTGGALTQSGIVTCSELQLNTGAVTLNNGLNGITGLSGSASGTVVLTTGVLLNVNNFDATGQAVAITAAGTASGGMLKATSLNLTSSADATLSTSITDLAANVTGFLNLTELNGLNILAGGVSASTGMKLTLSGGALTLGGGLTATGFTITLDSTGGTVSGAGVITAGTLTLSGTPTSVNASTAIANLGGTITGSGSITIANSGGALSVNSLNDAGGTVVISNGANSIGVNTLNAAGGSVALTGAGISGSGLSATGLTLTSAGNVNLGTTVSTLQATVTGAGNTLTITETDGLTVNGAGITTVNGAVSINSGALTVSGFGIATTGGAVGLTSSGTITVGGTGIVSSGGNVALNAASGLSLGGNVTAGGGTVTVHANAGGATQAGGAVTGTALEITGAGAFTLNGANDVTNFAANVNGALNFTDATGLTVSSAGSTNGIATAGNNLTLAVGGTLNLADNVNVGAAITTFNVSAGGINQSAGVLTTGSLLLKDTSNTVNAAFTLNAAGNSIGTLAVDVGSSTRRNSTLSVTVAGSIVIGSVSGTTGIKAGQTVTILAPNGTITVNAAIVSFGSLGTPQAFVTGQVYPLDPAVLGPLLQGNGTITLTAAPLPSGGGTIVFQLQPYNPNPNLLGGFNLAGLGNLGTNLSGDLGSLGSLGLDDNLKRDDLSSSVEKSISNIKFEKLNELMQNISQIIENQGDNESLRRSLDEVKNSEQMLLLANEALDESGGLLSRLQDGDPLKAILKGLIDDVHKAGDDVKNANLTLAQKISSLYGDRLDRLAEDALEGAIVGLRNANDRLRVAALVLRVASRKLMEGKLTAAQANDLVELIKQTRDDETLKAMQERERRDRLAEDARFASMQDLGNGKKNEKKDEPQK
ncbi:MAG: filamentous hemagglutinin N-terminal domain-containing protein [Planctomycetes bacterium]|nr:filamentous hemagglutinin N-terminal domain-containing protein [Planctomycetota bacterium]